MSKRADAKRARAAAAAPRDAGAICPPHPGFMHGMCIRCCARKEREDVDDGAEAEAHVTLSCAPCRTKARERPRTGRASR